MTSYVLRIIFVILMLGGLFAGGAWSSGAATLASELRRAFALPFLFVSRIFKSFNFASQVNQLALENQSLRAELELARLGLPKNDKRLLRAKIFTSYPFNDKYVIAISKGADHGVKTGMAVLSAPGIFLGEVIKTADDWSEVATVFDGSRQLPVRIGLSGVAGLLKGGSSISVSMIDKTRRINVGDSVFLAKSGLSYGLKIGSIRDVRSESGTAFNTAGVSLPYSLNELTDVFIIIE